MRRLLKLAVKLLLITLAVVSLCGMTAEGYADEIADAVPPEASEILDGARDNPRQQRCSFPGAAGSPRLAVGAVPRPSDGACPAAGGAVWDSPAVHPGEKLRGRLRQHVRGILGGGSPGRRRNDRRGCIRRADPHAEHTPGGFGIHAGVRADIRRVIAVMGKAATAAAVNTVTLGAAQFFSQLAVVFLSPVCGTVMGLSVTGAIHPELNISRLAELIKKVSVWGLSLLMTVFMSILSAQTFVRNAADSVLIRTAKFAVSSGVPIVGGTISDAVNTVSASLSLLHSGIGTYGIIAVLVMILPPSSPWRSIGGAFRGGGVQFRVRD